MLKKTLTTFAAMLLMTLVLSSCAGIESLEMPTSPVVADQHEPVVAESFGEDYFTVVGPAEQSYQPDEAGEITYCDLDALGRTTCAYGELTSSLRRDAQARGRQEITVDPSGWPTSNEEITIEAVPGLAGSQSYHGWMWNRSHLVAESLGGDAVVENLVTGTRTQNVGSTQIDGEFAGGMAHTERLAREYLDTHDGDRCPLYYAATPRYDSDELVPREVRVDIRSCDGVIDQQVLVSNSAQGFMIDHYTGLATPADQG